MRPFVRAQRLLVSPLIRWGPPLASRLVRGTWALSPKPDGEFLVEARDRFRFELRPRMGGSSAAVYYHGVYEAGTLHILTKALRGGDVFFDVGAFFGLMSAYASAAVGPEGSVHAFEPHPERFRRLERTLELNDLPNVTPHPVALGAAPGEAWMPRSPGSGRIRDKPGKGVAVPVLRLDDLAALTGKPHVVKVDVEGWEHAVLEGARSTLSLPDAPLLCVECTTKGPRDDRRRVHEYVTSSNEYSAFVLRGGKDAKGRLRPVRSAEDLPAHDNVFYLMPDQVARARRESWLT